ncbi:MAG TPA: hypothetical protein VG939_16725 [Caulobacteraceae bacterium]|nr:hypothetical protein [Caulobacteraceae bacterium]
MVRWIAVLAGVSSAAFASAAWAGDGVCKDVQRGAVGDHLRVALHVEHGRVTGAEAVFSPPRSAANDGVLLQLDLRYVQPSETGLGRPAEIALNTLHTDGGDVADLAGGNPTLVTDDGSEWTGRSSRFPVLIRTEFALRVDGAPLVQPELLDRLDRLKSVRVEVRAPDGSIVRQASYDLSDHAERDSLLRAAWAHAKQLADAPEPCGEPARR